LIQTVSTIFSAISSIFGTGSSIIQNEMQIEEKPV